MAKNYPVDAYSSVHLKESVIQLVHFRRDSGHLMLDAEMTEGLANAAYWSDVETLLVRSGAVSGPIRQTYKGLEIDEQTGVVRDPKSGQFITDYVKTPQLRELVENEKRLQARRKDKLEHALNNVRQRESIVWGFIKKELTAMGYDIPDELTLIDMRWIADKSTKDRLAAQATMARMEDIADKIANAINKGAKQ
jgi:hypothetical protein